MRWINTNAMLVNSMTKHVTFCPLIHALQMYGELKLAGAARISWSSNQTEYTEDDLLRNEFYADHYIFRWQPAREKSERNQSRLVQDGNAVLGMSGLGYVSRNNLRMVWQTSCLWKGTCGYKHCRWCMELIWFIRNNAGSSVTWRQQRNAHKVHYARSHGINQFNSSK